MRNRTIGLTALGLALAVGAGLYSSGNLQSLQGRFESTKPAITLALSSVSPSGNHPESAADSIMYFDVSSDMDTSLPVGTEIKFKFSGITETKTMSIVNGVQTSTAGAIDATASGATVYLKESGHIIGTGTLAIVDASMATAKVTTTSELTISEGSYITLYLELDSATLMSAKTVLPNTTVEQQLTIIAGYKGKTVTGNVLKF